jgi:hypothetical protein
MLFRIKVIKHQDYDRDIQLSETVDAPDVLREWIRVGRVKIGEIDGCWEWQGAKINGYGNLQIGKSAMLAHRVVMNAPADLMVLHSCDNPGCVNPKHLSLGTAHDNAQDMKRKGRGLRGVSGKPCIKCGIHCRDGSSVMCRECRAEKKGRICPCGKFATYSKLCERCYQRVNKAARRAKRNLGL